MTPPEEPLLKPCKYGMTHRDVCGCREYYQHEAESFKNLLTEKEAEIKHLEESRDAHVAIKNDAIKEALRSHEESAEQARLLEMSRSREEKLLAEIEWIKSFVPKADMWPKDFDAYAFFKKLEKQAEVIRNAREAMVNIQNELRTPTPAYAQPVAKAWYLAQKAIDKINQLENKK